MIKRVVTERSRSVDTEREKDQLIEITGGRLQFRPNLHVSHQSVYGDDVWSWYDDSNHRLRRYYLSDTSIDWKSLQTNYGLSDPIIADLKKYAFLRYAYSTTVFRRSKKNSHPASLVHEVRYFAKFLGHLILNLSVNGFGLITTLSEIEVQDIEEALASYPGAKAQLLKKVFTLLGSDRFSKHLDCGPLKWNEADSQNLPWIIKDRTPYERLPEEVFRLLSNEATADVKQFLRALKITPEDSTPIGETGNKFLEAFLDFNDVFEEYIRIRNTLREGRDRKGPLEYEKLMTKFNRDRGANSLQQLADLVDRARTAGQITIMAYTGARVSELAGFRRGCLRRKGEGGVIVGTQIKGQDTNAPIDQDEWVAIPIVRDAVRLLEETARVIGAELLFHGNHCSPAKQKPMVSQVLTKRVKAYLDSVDQKGVWTNLKPHSHRFRHSLVFELRKAGLGLPFITYQLKHAYSAIDRSINQTTIGYGGLSSNAVQKAIDDANLIAFSEIYHPEAPVAGGGAAALRQRRLAYFEGMALRGIKVDQVLRYFAKEGGMPLTDVGLGYCQGQTKIVLDGVKTDPPCIGSLRCNPVRCANGIIPAHKAPLWERAAEENRRRAVDPQFSYARSYLEEAAAEAEEVVKFFQIQGLRRKGEKDG